MRILLAGGTVSAAEAAIQIGVRSTRGVTSNLSAAAENLGLHFDEDLILRTWPNGPTVV